MSRKDAEIKKWFSYNKKTLVGHLRVLGNCGEHSDVFHLGPPSPHTLYNLSPESSQVQILPLAGWLTLITYQVFQRLCFLFCEMGSQYLIHTADEGLNGILHIFEKLTQCLGNNPCSIHVSYFLSLSAFLLFRVLLISIPALKPFSLSYEKLHSFHSHLVFKKELWTEKF